MVNRFKSAQIYFRLRHISQMIFLAIADQKWTDFQWISLAERFRDGAHSEPLIGLCPYMKTGTLRPEQVPLQTNISFRGSHDLNPESISASTIEKNVRFQTKDGRSAAGLTLQQWLVQNV